MPVYVRPYKATLFDRVPEFVLDNRGNTGHFEANKNYIINLKLAYLALESPQIQIVGLCIGLYKRYLQIFDIFIF